MNKVVCERGFLSVSVGILLYTREGWALLVSWEFSLCSWVYFYIPVEADVVWELEVPSEVKSILLYTRRGGRCV